MFKRLSIKSIAVENYLASMQDTAGVYNRGLFKAIFLAGGPGSGKSHIRGQISGGIGLKVVDSDILFKMRLQEHNLSLDFSSHSEEDKARRDELRAQASHLTDRQLLQWVDARLGIVIDLTGKDVAWVKKLHDWLNQIGYETYMVFVNTDLEVALQRNRQRLRKNDRSLDDDMVSKLWHQVQNNLGALQQIFTSGFGNGAANFKVIDNSEDFERDDKGRLVIPDNVQQAYRQIVKFVNTPLSAAAPKKWIRDELAGVPKKDREKLPPLPADD